MKKLLWAFCAVLAFTSITANGVTNTSMSSTQVCATSSQSNNYEYVKKVNVYVLRNGEFKSDGTNEIYKDSRGYLYIKAKYGSQLYRVFKTTYPNSKYFNSYAIDEWGYTCYFDV